MFKRVNKPTARKLFRKGKNIYLVPCKCRLIISNPFSIYAVINWQSCVQSTNKFDRTVNEFEYYNCSSETGTYTHFYVEED